MNECHTAACLRSSMARGPCICHIIIRIPLVPLQLLQPFERVKICESDAGRGETETEEDATRCAHRLTLHNNTFALMHASNTGCFGVAIAAGIASLPLRSLIALVWQSGWSGMVHSVHV